MTNAVEQSSNSPSFLAWFRSFLREELAPYPGRGLIVARMIIAATVTMILIVTFRIFGGFEGALYAFMVSRDDMRSTLKSGLAIVVSYTIGVVFLMAGAGLFASHPSSRLLWFAGSMFVVFFAMHTFKDFAVATGFAVILVLALPIWQMPLPAEKRVELTLWQALACVLGTIVTILVEAVFRAFYPRNSLIEGMDDRLSSVQRFLEGYAVGQTTSSDVANRLVKYAMVGSSGLRRSLVRSRYEQHYRDQLNAVIALIGRLVDLASTAARSRQALSAPDIERLNRLISQIAEVRQALGQSRHPVVFPAPVSEPSAMALLPEMERTLSLIPYVFSDSESTDAYCPSLIDQEEKEDAGGFFKSDAFQNPAHIAFAMRGCLAATLCYFTYEMIAWLGIATSVTTCVLTALSNVGTSRQKQLLRISGAIVGGLILGIGSQIFILPYLDSIVSFSLLFATITGIAAWCATSSQRLSYFGLQIANAYYLVTISGFNFDPSLATGRDRVAGILLGLFVMWLAFHSVGTASAAEHMVQSFSSNLRAIAELAQQPGDAVPELALQRIFALRKQIGDNFEAVRAQSDAIPFEFGVKQRAAGMANRALIRSWLPQLQAIYLMEVSLMQHKIYGTEEHLPPSVPIAQQRFDEACAGVFVQLADRIDGKHGSSAPALNASLDNLTKVLQESSSHHSGFAAAHGIGRMAREISIDLAELSQDIVSSKLAVKTIA